MEESRVKHITDASFDDAVLKADAPVLVDFWAPWCGPCKMVAPVLDELARDYDGKVDVVKLNVDENPNTAQKYGVRGIPTLILFKGGQIEEQIVGAVPKAQLEAILSKQS